MSGGGLAPAGRPPKALLLYPGAGADREHPGLVALDEAASGLGLVVARADFPYRRAGRKVPDKAPALVAAVVEEAAALAAAAGCAPDEIVLGGRSMGGRMCSMAVAEGLPAAGLLLVSYPLHPPGKPEVPRTAHLPGLRVPCCFVSGTRDPFGTPAELEAATALIPGPVTFCLVEGGDHGLRGKNPAAAAHATAWLAGLTA